MNPHDYSDVRIRENLGRISHIEGGARVVEAANKQMQRWLAAQQGREPAPLATGAEAARGLGPYLAISREAGAGGSRIAELVGKAVGWEVFDQGLLESVAERYHTSPEVLKLVDETTTNWITEIFGSWLDRTSVSQMQYVCRLSRVILMTARAGRAIYVGRGARYVLPRDRGLSVRIIAPLKYRIQQIMEQRHLSFEEAREYVVKTDADRQEFIRHYFHHDVNDSHLYDLIINVESIGHERAAGLISEALVSCFDARRSP